MMKNLHILALSSFCLICKGETEQKLPQKVTLGEQAQAATPPLEPTPPKQKMLTLAPDKSSDYLRNKQHLEQTFSRDLPVAKDAKQHFQEKPLALEPKKSTSSFWSSVTISDMDYQQLLQRKNELIVTGDYLNAAKYLERMFKLSQTPEQMVYIMLEWGEILMHLEDYKRAETMFRDFVKLYPGNEYAEAAFIKAIDCSWRQTTIPERDQTKTEDTLALINDFFSRKTVYSAYGVQRVTEFQQLCFDKLAKSNLGIAKHYIGRSQFKGARKRLDAIRSTDLKNLPSIEPELLQLEVELAQAEQQTELMQQKLAELNTKFPQHEITLALNDPKKSWLSSII